MSNQLQITGDLKVKSLTGALTATAGVVSSVPLGTANGVATLGTDGKVPSSQLPTLGSSYKGTWNAATNTPYIVDGVGTSGDYYLVSTGGTWNGIVFVAGNTVIYSGTVWQRAGGGTGTVTSVGLSAPTAFSITGSPITGAGTLAIAGAGTANDYIKGNGTLGLFSTAAISAVSGTYLPLAGGTLTGALSGTSATFSSTLQSGSITIKDGGNNGQGTLNLGSTNGYFIQGGADYTAMNFHTNATERMRITSGGNIGIGTSSPDKALVVGGVSTLTATATPTAIALDNSYFNNSVANGDTLKLYILRGGVNIGFGAGNIGDFNIWCDGLTRFYNGGSERMRITSGGNIGIGTSSPSSLSSGVNLITRGVGANSTAYIQALSLDGSASVALYSGSSSSDNPSLVYQNSLRFATANDSGISGYLERMRITSNGSLLVGTTTDVGASNKLQVDGNIYMYYGSVFNFTGSSPINNILVRNLGSTFSIGGPTIILGLLTSYNEFNTQTSNYTLVLTDASKIVEMDALGANTVTVPTNASVAFPIGTEITVMQLGAGVTTIVAASGVTFRSIQFSTRIADQYTGATLIKRGTNEWYIIGNIAP